MSHHGMPLACCPLTPSSSPQAHRSPLLVPSQFSGFSTASHSRGLKIWSRPPPPPPLTALEPGTARGSGLASLAPRCLPGQTRRDHAKQAWPPYQTELCWRPLPRTRCCSLPLHPEQLSPSPPLAIARTLTISTGFTQVHALGSPRRAQHFHSPLPN